MFSAFLESLKTASSIKSCILKYMLNLATCRSISQISILDVCFTSRRNKSHIVKIDFLFSFFPFLKQEETNFALSHDNWV